MTLPDRVGGILVERAADAVAAAPAGVSAGKPAGGRLPVPANQRAVRPAQRRGGLAVVLGALTSGVGALIPLLDFGKHQESNCAALMSQAKSDAGVKASDIAPRTPGKR